MSDQPKTLPPGFRFYPTDEELIVHYLRNRAASTPCPAAIAAEIDIYKFDPWELPEKALFGDHEWYFFTPRDRKYPNGVRPNRSAASGYWKATGTDKPISVGNGSIGVKKALVFYKGRPPKGIKTNWIMHEYRLPDTHSTNTYRPMRLRDASMRLDDWVLCRIYKKSSNLPSDNSGAQDEVSRQQNTAKLAKSLSVSDYLDDYSAISHLFDEVPSESVADMMNTSGKQPLIDSNYLVQQLSQTGSSARISSGNYLKRQRAEEEFGVGFPSKRTSEPCSFTNLGNQFDGPQYNNLVNHQSLLSQQLLLNSHLGLH